MLKVTSSTRLVTPAAAGARPRVRLMEHRIAATTGMLVASTLNPSFRSTDHFLVVHFNEDSVLTLTDHHAATYTELKRFASREWGIQSSSLVIESDELDTCPGKRVRIHEEAWIGIKTIIANVYIRERQNSGPDILQQPRALSDLSSQKTQGPTERSQSTQNSTERTQFIARPPPAAEQPPQTQAPSFMNRPSYAQNQLLGKGRSSSSGPNSVFSNGRAVSQPLSSTFSNQEEYPSGRSSFKSGASRPPRQYSNDILGLFSDENRRESPTGGDDRGNSDDEKEEVEAHLQESKSLQQSIQVAQLKNTREPLSDMLSSAPSSKALSSTGQSTATTTKPPAAGGTLAQRSGPSPTSTMSDGASSSYTAINTINTAASFLPQSIVVGPTSSSSASTSDRVLIVVEVPKTGIEARGFRIKRDHTVQTVLKGAAKIFKIDCDRSNLHMIVSGSGSQGDDWRTVKCDKNASMKSLGIEDGQRFIIEDATLSEEEFFSE